MPDYNKNKSPEEEDVEMRLRQARRQADSLRRRAEMLKKFAQKYRDSSHESLFGIKREQKT
jgi:hypothetical protein